MGTLASETAKSMALCVNGRPCEDLAPLRHIMAERKREKLMQHLIHAIVVLCLGVVPVSFILDMERFKSNIFS